MGVSNLSFLEGILEVPGKSQSERNICGHNRCLINKYIYIYNTTYSSS